jgi:DNA replication and repair protein RecF
VGENGSGKTSVLEAIYMALVGKSFRNVDSEIVKREREFYRVVVRYVGGEEVAVGYDGRRVFRAGGKKYGRLPKKYRYPVVCFVPEDLNLISSSPSRKREFFDRWISQIDESYRAALSKYNKALRQRNELLKRGGGRAQVFAWDVMLARYGSEIIVGREKMIGEVNNRLTEIYRTIADNGDEVFIKYESEVYGEDESRYLARIEGSFERDKILGYTTVGVHRDDYGFVFNGKRAEGSASRGESRSIILALKFIEAQMIEEVIGKEPVVLLDDIFSELDEVRQRHLIRNFKRHQVIITSVGMPRDMEGEVRL